MSDKYPSTEDWHPKTFRQALRLHKHVMPHELTFQEQLRYARWWYSRRVIVWWQTLTIGIGSRILRLFK